MGHGSYPAFPLAPIVNLMILLPRPPTQKHNHEYCIHSLSPPNGQTPLTAVAVPRSNLSGIRLPIHQSIHHRSLRAHNGGNRLGWGALVLAGGGAYYFAKREINEERRQQHLALQQRQRIPPREKGGGGRLTGEQANKMRCMSRNSAASATPPYKRRSTNRRRPTSACAKIQSTRLPRSIGVPKAIGLVS